MSDYIALGLITARHADLLREADEARLARICRSQQRQRHRSARALSNASSALVQVHWPQRHTTRPPGITLLWRR